MPPTTDLDRDLGAVLARVRARADQQAAANKDARKKLVRRLVRGEDIIPEALLKECEKLGYDIYDLQADVEREAERFELRAAADTLAEHQAAHRVATSGISRAESELAKALEKLHADHDTKVTPLVVAAEAAAAGVKRAEDAADRLRRLAPPDVVEAIERARAEWNAAASELNEYEATHAEGTRKLAERTEAARRSIPVLEQQLRQDYSHILDPQARATAEKLAAEELARVRGIAEQKPNPDAVAHLERLRQRERRLADALAEAEALRDVV